jgi:hypothetical protein
MTTEFNRLDLSCYCKEQASICLWCVASDQIDFLTVECQLIRQERDGYAQSAQWRMTEITRLRMENDRATAIIVSQRKTIACQRDKFATAAPRLEQLPAMDAAGMGAFADYVHSLSVGLALHAKELEEENPILHACIVCGQRASERARGCDHVAFCLEHAEKYRSVESARIVDARAERSVSLRAELLVDGDTSSAVQALLDEEFGAIDAHRIACPYCRLETVGYATISVPAEVASEEEVKDATAKVLALRRHHHQVDRGGGSGICPV